jgi:hypothetical protein
MSSYGNSFGFTFQDVVRAFPEKNHVHLARILADMVDKGMLCTIARGQSGPQPETHLKYTVFLKP